ncbi:MAG: hypothetical protein JWL66_782, partial [Sphingomonadales bacterium]|nr:hypothetical protein [Sphingomonadales bacterium]
MATAGAYQRREWYVKLGRRARSIALFEQLGPGLVTGAADDDPSG